jgi:hypothetical protein
MRWIVPDLCLPAATERSGLTRCAEAPPEETTRALQRQAWEWVLIHRSEGGQTPLGRSIGAALARGERWGRMVKRLASEESSRRDLCLGSPS